MNPLLQDAGLIDKPILFFATHTNAFLSTVFMIVWKFVGLYMLILLVGLQAIPTELYEAASIDGAGRWQTFRHITLPLLRPSLALALILCVTGSLLAFDHFYMLTKGGPDNSTVTIVQLIYQQAFVRQNLGTAAALSIVLLVALLILNTFWFRLLRRRGGSGVSDTMRPAMFARTPYYVFTGGLVILFLFPLVWAIVARSARRPARRRRSATASATTSGSSISRKGCRRYFMNSVIIALLTVLITLTVSTLGGYAFARFDFPGKNILFLLTLAILMVPYATLLIPLYVLLRQIGARTTRWSASAWSWPCTSCRSPRS